MEGFAAAVKKIVDVQITTDGTKYFRVCWKDTWEPELHLLTCQNLIEEFWKTQQKQPQPLQDSPKVKYNEGSEVETEDENPLLIQCDHINTTSSKQSDSKTSPLPAPTTVHSTPVNPSPENVEILRTYNDCATQCCICCVSTPGGKEDSGVKRKTVSKEVGMQCEIVIPSFNSYHNDERQMDNDILTRDIGCQCGPEVRHFAVQKQLEVEEKVEVAEVSIQVSPDVCSISSQCSLMTKVLRPERDFGSRNDFQSKRKSSLFTTSNNSVEFLDATFNFLPLETKNSSLQNCLVSIETETSTENPNTFSVGRMDLNTPIESSVDNMNCNTNLGILSDTNIIADTVNDTNIIADTVNDQVLQNECFIASDDDQQIVVQEEIPTLPYVPVTSQEPLNNMIQLPCQQSPYIHSQQEVLLPVSSINPNQVLQTEPLYVSQVSGWSNASFPLTTKPDVFKEMLFVVNETSQQQQQQQPFQNQPLIVFGNGQQINTICKPQTAEGTSVIPSLKHDTKPVCNRKRRRNRKNSEHKQDEQSSDKISVCSIFSNVSDKIVYSRSLFPVTDQAVVTEQQNASPPNKMRKKLSTPVAYPMEISSETSVTTVASNACVVNNSPTCNLNESNVSTVYDPSPTGRSTKNSGPENKKNATKTSKDKKQLTRTCSLSKEEKSINDNFISKYWK